MNCLVLTVTFNQPILQFRSSHYLFKSVRSMFPYNTMIQQWRNDNENDPSKTNKKLLTKNNNQVNKQIWKNIIESCVASQKSKVEKKHHNLSTKNTSRKQHFSYNTTVNLLLLWLKYLHKHSTWLEHMHFVTELVPCSLYSQT